MDVNVRGGAEFRYNGSCQASKTNIAHLNEKRKREACDGPHVPGLRIRRAGE